MLKTRTHRLITKQKQKKLKYIIIINTVNLLIKLHSHEICLLKLKINNNFSQTAELLKKCIRLCLLIVELSKRQLPVSVSLNCFLASQSD